MHDLIIDKVKAYIEKYGLIHPGDSVLIALSGGADSMALSDILLVLSKEMDLTVSAAHMNHMLRGDESDYDEFFVRNYCAQRNIPLIVEKADINSLSHEMKLGTEECARAVRYQFLNRAARNMNSNLIATAHSLSDNAESLLLNITRGCGTNGINGILQRRDNIIRPLLCLTRKEIEQYDKLNSIPFVTDSTNSNTDYTRNYIRKEVVPKLIDINPSFYDAVNRLVTTAKEDNDFLFGLSVQLLDNALLIDDSYSLKVLKNAPRPVLKRALNHYYCKITGKTLPFQHLNELSDYVLSDKSGYHQLPFGIYAYKEYNSFKFVNTTEREEVKRFFLEAGESTQLNDGRVVNITSQFEDFILKDSFDADKIVGSLSLRLKNPMDKIKLYKRPNKSLKKIFNENRIPIHKRDSAIVLCDDEGIVWVENIGVAERVMVDNNSSNIKKIYIEE